MSRTLRDDRRDQLVHAAQAIARLAQQREIVPVVRPSVLAGSPVERAGDSGAAPF